jgi:S-adenosylmethionine-diacylglycerol 3-amino-3-carboxypropyl transferase
MIAPPLKFAVVREDPLLELWLVQRLGGGAALVVASGGCTVLTLARLVPGLPVTAFDLNPTQLAHLEAKRAAAAAGDASLLNVGDPRHDGLNQRGAFEGLFRLLRAYLEEFVAPREEMARLFSSAPGVAERADIVARWTTSPYWRAAFATCFNDDFLVAMFGPEAIQHAERGSYPGYFQAAFERGLRAPHAARNPFLQHVLLGCYRVEDAPAYVRGGALAAPEIVIGTLADVPDLGRFSLFSLSNVFDWSGDALVADWAATLVRHARPGAAVLIRQLNNRRDLRRFFQPTFVFDDAVGASLRAADRSLFYERVEVGFRR